MDSNPSPRGASLTPAKGSLVREPTYGWRPRNAVPEADAKAAVEPAGPSQVDGRIVDFVRPMTWFPALAAARPGMLVAIWGFIAVLRSGRMSMPKPMSYIYAFLAVMVINVPFAMNNRWAFDGMLEFAIHMWGRVAHSLYMTLLAEEGIAGVILFVLMVKWSLTNLAALRRRSSRNPKDADARTAALLGSGVSAGIFALLATGAFLSILYYPVLWVLLAFLSAIVRTARDDTVAAS